MSYKYLEVALNFSTFDFPGVLWTNPTLMIIDGKWTGGNHGNHLQVVNGQVVTMVTIYRW